MHYFTVQLRYPPALTCLTDFDFHTENLDRSEFKRLFDLKKMQFFHTSLM